MYHCLWSHGLRPYDNVWWMIRLLVYLYVVCIYLTFLIHSVSKRTTKFYNVIQTILLNNCSNFIDILYAMHTMHARFYLRIFDLCYKHFGLSSRAVFYYAQFFFCPGFPDIFWWAEGLFSPNSIKKKTHFYPQGQNHQLVLLFRLLNFCSLALDVQILMFEKYC